ncbi:MAG: recombinase family protein [Clostridia bacterium]|nr:recombinase family protein [Clostridia bacterium]
MSKRAVIYARFSSHTQTEQSIEGQLRECNDYAKKHDLLIVGEYIDRALTGTTDKRPNFLQMIDDSKKKTFDYVLVYQLDRFARNRYDSANYKAKLKKNGVRVLSAKENITEDASGILIEGVLESMAEYYSAELSQKVRRGIRESLSKGYFIGGYKLFGYDIVDKRWTMNLTEAPIVKDMFERYKNGEKAKSIVNRLNNMGIHNKSGARFTVNSFSKIIRNSKYMGVVISNGITYTNIVPAIVDEQTFTVCNKIMDNQRHKQKAVHEHSEYLLSGKLFCGNCGTLMTAEDGTSHTGKVYHYYKCFNRKLHKEQCQKNNITKEKLEDLVFSKTIEYVLQPNVIDKLSFMVTNKFNAGLQRTDMLALLEKEQKQVQNAIGGFLSAIAAGIVTKSTKEKLVELELQSEELEGKIILEKARQIQPLECEKLKAFLTYFANKQYKNDEEKNEFFNSFIYRVVLFDDYVYIFYNVSPNMPLKVKLDKSDLNELREYSENKKSTQFVPLGFKLGAVGGERGIRTPG